MRPAIYARVSTADGGQGTENQLAELRRFASVRAGMSLSSTSTTKAAGACIVPNAGASSRTRLGSHNFEAANRPGAALVIPADRRCLGLPLIYRYVGWPFSISTRHR